VTLLFSDKKSEEEKGAVCEWILLHAKKLKALLQNAKKSHPKKRGFWRRFRASFSPRQTKGQIKMPFLCSDFNNTFHETTRMRKGFRSERRRR
jgi:hypothetical protein